MLHLHIVRSGNPCESISRSCVVVGFTNPSAFVFAELRTCEQPAVLVPKVGHQPNIACIMHEVQFSLSSLCNIGKTFRGRNPYTRTPVRSAALVRTLLCCFLVLQSEWFEETQVRRQRTCGPKDRVHSICQGLTMMLGCRCTRRSRKQHQLGAILLAVDRETGSFLWSYLNAQ